MKFGAIALAIAAGFASAANAEEKAIGSGWAGAYFGFGYGFQMAVGELRVPSGTARFEAGISDGKVGSDGFSLLGYNWVSGNLVYGIEGEFGVHETKDMAALPLDIYSTDNLWHAALRGRLGYDLGNFLPFVTLGATLNEVNYHSTDEEIGVSTRNLGLTAGVGVDYAWTDNIVTRLEYAYSLFPDKDIAYNWDNTPVVPGSSASLQSHEFRVAVIIREGAGGNSGRRFAPGRGGFYAGGLTGGGLGVGGNSNPGAVVDNSYVMPGAELSLFGGFDYPIGNFFIGADVTGRAIFNDGSAGGVPGAAGFINDIGARQLWTSDARLRAGYRFGDFSPYVAGGFSLTQVETYTQSRIGARPTADFSMHYGGTAAVGLDYEVNDRLFVRGEYAYSYYTDASSKIGLPTAGEHHLQTHAVRIGVGLRLTD